MAGTGRWAAEGTDGAEVATHSACEEESSCWAVGRALKSGQRPTSSLSSPPGAVPYLPWDASNVSRTGCIGEAPGTHTRSRAALTDIWIFLSSGGVLEPWGV